MGITCKVLTYIHINTQHGLQVTGYIDLDCDGGWVGAIFRWITYEVLQWVVQCTNQKEIHTKK